MSTPHPPRTRFNERIAALAFFLFLAIVITWPLIIHLGDRLPGWYVADNYEYLWKMWWFKHALVDLHTSPLVAPMILSPDGFPLAYAEITPLHTLIGLPLTLILGETAAYNLFALGSFVIAGWAVYLLVFRWTANSWAGVFAGVLFILNPYHVVRYGGILPLMAIEGLPVFLLGVEGWVFSRRPLWIALAGLGYFLSAWASIYYAFGLLILGPLYLVVRLATSQRQVVNRNTIAHMAILLLLVLAITLPLALPYLSLRSSSDLTIPLQDTDYWSASPTDYILPPGLHPLWGTWVMKNALGVPAEYPQIAFEFVLAGGYVALLFAAYGAFKCQATEKKAVVAMTAAAFVLSLGTTLHIARHPLLLPAPPAVVDAFNRFMESVGVWLPAHESYAPLAGSGLTVPLPALLLRWVIPPLTGMRAWNRFAAFTSLGLSLLAGLGFALWIRAEVQPKNSHLKARLATLAFMGFALFELWPRAIPLQPIGPRPVDLWLAAQPEQGSLMELPLTSALSAPQMLYTRYHGKPISFAYGTFLPYWYRQQYPELEQCPKVECLTRLRRWGVIFILLNLSDPSGGPSLEAQLDLSPSLERVTTVGDHVVYRLLP
jgi:hypothetical protein